MTREIKGNYFTMLRQSINNRAPGVSAAAQAVHKK
jgi:hypothetical protein